MKAGKLRKRVAIQSRTDSVSDETMAPTQTWTTVATVWASVEPLSGQEGIQANQLNAELSHRVTIRYYSGLTAAYRILWGTRVLRIVSVLNTDERNREMVLSCMEEKN